MKQNDTINYLKTLFSKKSIWESKYVTIQGSKLFIYKDQKLNKPQRVIDLTGNFNLDEVRKIDASGKENVFNL